MSYWQGDPGEKRYYPNSGRCLGLTDDGGRCKKKVKGGGFCFMHDGLGEKIRGVLALIRRSYR